MVHTKGSPHNLSDAIHRLEKTTDPSSFCGKNWQSEKDFEAIKEAFEALKPHLKNLKDDLAHQAGELLTTSIQQAKENIKRGHEAVQDFSHHVDDKVHEHPWWAMGLAGLLGLLMGYLLGRKK